MCRTLKLLKQLWFILISNSLVYTPLIVESYKSFIPTTGDSMHTVLLLQQISQQLAGISNSSTNTALPSYPLCQPTPSTVLSLCFGLACALTATFVQQWACNCLQAIERRPAPHKKARTRAFLCGGMKSFGMTIIVDGIPTLLHIAVFLFFFFCRPCWPSFIVTFLPAICHHSPYKPHCPVFTGGYYSS